MYNLERRSMTVAFQPVILRMTDGEKSDVIDRRYS
jgi:hypothetical protein